MSKKKHKQHNPGQVIFPVNHQNPPQQHEIDVAYILASHYRTTVEFLIPLDDYKRKSADIKMLGVLWEIKSPSGDSKSTIGNQFRNASRQSGYMILDARRTKMDMDIVERKVQIEASKRTKLKRIILIDKFEKVIEIKK